jgi:hypothetical protein
LSLYNRPGLPALHYRVGAWGDFRATMQAQLSSAALPALAGLRTREGDDASMALLDAWAMTADVLSFYQERYANEGYLRTACERLSLAELARLVGYEPRPGVAASVHLAYTLDDTAEPVTVLAGARAQSVPGPGEKMQSFETSDALLARADWNRLQPRLGRIEQIPPLDALTRTELVIAGAATRLAAGDRVMFDYTRGTGMQIIRTVASADPDFSKDHDRLNVRLQSNGLVRHDEPSQAVASLILAVLALARKIFHDFGNGMIKAPAAVRLIVQALRNFLLGGDLPTLYAQLVRALHGSQLGSMPADVKPLFELAVQLQKALEKLAAVDDDPAPAQPATNTLFDVLTPLAVRPKQTPLRQFSQAELLAPRGDVVPQLISRFTPRLGDVLYHAWRNLPVSAATAELEGLHVLRIAAPLFAYNYITEDSRTIAAALSEDKQTLELFLDTVYSGVLVGSWAVVQTEYDTGGVNIPLRVMSAKSVTQTDDSGKVSAQTTRLLLRLPERGPIDWPATQDLAKKTINGVLVLAQSEPLALAAKPDDMPIAGKQIELAELYDGLKPGRWIILRGERRDVIGADKKPIAGIQGGELALLVGVVQEHDANVPGDYTHTTLQLARDLQYSYARDSVTIYGNVVHATHGETRNEVLGSSDARKSIQRFTLKQAPLTYVAAATPQGVATTLEVRVNDVRWHETAMPAFATPGACVYSVRQDDDGNSTVIFGNRGARLPSGSENLRAKYRNGIGMEGNVKAAQISLLATKPTGVRDVINPLRASGGGDRDGVEAIRRNAPIAVMALDRLVSLPDYADFARAFAGIGQARADRVGNGKRDFVQVTIAGGDDAPIDSDSDLYTMLGDALRRFGDPHLPVEVASRELVALVISANVAIDPDYDWAVVQPKLRQTLLDRFSFTRRALGQRAYLSEAVSALQAVRGVVYVDVDLFDGISESDLRDPDSLKDRLEQFETSPQPNPFVAAHGGRDEVADGVRVVRPAQLAYLVPGVSETLVLNLLSTTPR